MQVRFSFMKSFETSVSMVRGRGRGTSKSALRRPGRRVRTATRRTEIDRLVDIVSDEQDGHSIFGPHLQEQFLHHQTRLRVEGAEGLIHKHDPRLVDQDTRQTDTLLHAPGELGGIMPIKFGKTNLPEESHRPFGSAAARGTFRNFKPKSTFCHTNFQGKSVGC